MVFGSVLVTLAGEIWGAIFAPELGERERELVWVITVLPAVSAQLGPLIEDFSAQNYKLVWQRWAKSLTKTPVFCDFRTASSFFLTEKGA
jgi:hypothetical protein